MDPQIESHMKNKCAILDGCITEKRKVDNISWISVIKHVAVLKIANFIICTIGRLQPWKPSFSVYVVCPRPGKHIFNPFSFLTWTSPKCYYYRSSCCMEKWAIVVFKDMTGHLEDAPLFMAHIKLYAKVKHLFTDIAQKTFFQMCEFGWTWIYDKDLFFKDKHKNQSKRSF